LNSPALPIGRVLHRRLMLGVHALETHGAPTNRRDHRKVRIRLVRAVVGREAHLVSEVATAAVVSEQQFQDVVAAFVGHGRGLKVERTTIVATVLLRAGGENDDSSDDS